MVTVARIANVYTTYRIGILQVSIDKMASRCKIAILVLSVSSKDCERRCTYRRVLVGFVGIAGYVCTVISRQAQAQPFHPQVIHTPHIGRRGEAILLKESLLAVTHPVVAAKAVGVESCYDHQLIIEPPYSMTNRTKQFDPRLVPGRGQDGGLPLWT